LHYGLNGLTSGFRFSMSVKHEDVMRSLILVFITAVLLNYLWELAQAPLYVGMDSYNAGVLWHCFVATLGDGIMVLLIVTAGWITLRQPAWFLRPTLRGYFTMLTAGFVLALVVEWIGVRVLERWKYTENMPMLPGLNIGLVPIAQMLLLPPLIFRIISYVSQEH
jgi:hypothetical protein